MAEQQEPLSLASTFPNPPSFWNDFTPENVARIDELRKEYADTHEGDVPARIPGLPPSLANLQPPAEPSDGSWRVFGDHYTLEDRLPTLEEQGIHNLLAKGPSSATDEEPAAATDSSARSDRALELKQLVKSLLLKFLELTGTLSTDPSGASAKVDDLRTQLINIHHAINEYRPHQARESAAEMMQDHLDRIRRETDSIRSQVDRARKVLDGLGSLTIQDVPASLTENPEDMDKPDWGVESKKRDGELWSAVDALIV